MARILFIEDRSDDFDRTIGEGREKEKKEFSLRRKKRRERERETSMNLGVCLKVASIGIPTNFIITDPLRHQSLQLEPNGFMLNR